MNKLQFDKWLEEIRSYGIKPGLSRVIELLNRLDNPQDKLNIIHITGTNGKGTTATLLRHILEEEYKVGQFSTPSIISFNHMFYVDGPISDEVLYRISDQIKTLCEDMVSDGLEYPTEYEIIAAIMYQYFYECHVDFAIVEVAMGGENDCTNVMNHSILSIMTEISLDHTNFFGPTLLDIAKEKSGVIKNNSAVIVHPQDEDVFDYIKNDADKKLSILRSFEGQVDCFYDDMMTFAYKGLEVKTKMMGDHQARNIIGVIEAINYLNEKGYASVSKEQLLNSIENTVFEGRFERIEDWILDGAHNHESLMGLKSVLEHLDLYHLNGVFAALKDKDIDEALKALAPHFDLMIVTEANSFRKCPAGEMSDRMSKLGYKNIIIEENINKAFQRAEKTDQMKLVFGSFYMLSELRPLIKKVH